MPNDTARQHKPDQAPKLSTPLFAKNPLLYARVFGDIAKSIMLVMFWTIAGCVTLTIAVISLTALYWLTKLIIQALGVN